MNTTRLPLFILAIYLSYAKFVAYGMPDSEEMIED